MTARRPSSLSTAFEKFESAENKIGYGLMKIKQNTLSVHQKRETYLINYKLESTSLRRLRHLNI
jgi:hypothetical protein